MGSGEEAFWDSCDALRIAEPPPSHSSLPLPPIPRLQNPSQDMGTLNTREMHNVMRCVRGQVGIPGDPLQSGVPGFSSIPGHPRFQGELYGRAEQAL